MKASQTVKNDIIELLTKLNAYMVLVGGCNRTPEELQKLTVTELLEQMYSNGLGFEITSSRITVKPPPVTGPILPSAPDPWCPSWPSMPEWPIPRPYTPPGIIDPMQPIIIGSGEHPQR